MKLVFLDETGDEKFKDFLGISVAIIDAAHYAKTKQGFQQALRQASWNESVEFKGSHIFSASKGDPAVDVDQRIALAGAILRLNVANKYARMSFYFGSQTGVTNVAKAYLQSAPSFLAKVLPKPMKGGKAKNLLAITADYRNDVKAEDLQNGMLPLVHKRGWELFEQVSLVHSNFHTVGILFADIVGYLAARVETISNDSELFEGIPPQELEKHGKFKKLQSSTQLLSLIKNMKLYEKVAI